MEAKTILNNPEQVSREYQDTDYSIAKQIKLQLIKAKKKVVEGDMDRIYAITGREGLGKSTLAMQLGYFLDPTFCLDDVVFNADQFEKRVRESDKFKTIVFDECFNGLSSRGSLSKENKRLLRLLQEVRQRNLFIFLVLPSFFLLEKYAAIFRTHCLFNVMQHKKNYKLRYYKVYNYHQKKKLFIYGKDLMDYTRPKIVKKHRFFKKLPPVIDENEYRKKKFDAFKDKPKELTDLEKKHLAQRNVLFKKLHEEGMSIRKISQMMIELGVGINPTNVFEAIKGTGNNVLRSPEPSILKNRQEMGEI